MGRLIRSEYWITDGDFVVEVGECSDYNHEGYAAQQAQHLLLSFLGQERDEPSDKDLCPALVEYLTEEEHELFKVINKYGDLELPDGLDDDYGKLCELALPLLLADNKDKDERYFTELFDAAWYIGDTRNWAAEFLGWKTIHGHEIGTWTLTKDDFKTICGGILDVIGDWQEEDDEKNDNEEFSIWVVSTERTYTVSFKDIKDMNYEALGISQSPPEIGPNYQVQELDKALMNPVYKTIGD